jgi:hypothetical protein
MAVVDELVAILGYETKGEGELKRFQRNIDSAAKSISVLGVAVGTFVGTLATQAFNKLGDAIGSLPGNVIKTSAMFESFQATLETVEGSAEKARESLDWISDFAKKTPFEVEELTRSFVKLRAYGMDPTTGLLEDLGNASSAMGKNLMDAVEMIADASTGEFERLKEFGIRASQAGEQVTFSWTENGKTLTKTVKKTSDEITKFIQERFGARFSGAMMRQSKTWNGMMSNLSDSWTDFQRRIGEAGFFDAVRKQLGRVLDFIGRLDADGTLDRWAKGLSSAFTRASDFIADFAERAGRHFNTISRVINENKGAWEWLKWVLGAIAFRLFPMTFVFGALALAIEDVLQWMGNGKSVIGDFVAALEDFLGLDRGALDGVIATLMGFAGLAVAAIGLSAFTLSLSPLTQALLAFGAAALAAKEGFEYLKALKSETDARIANSKAVSNPRSTPGYIESGGYDANGNFIYMDGPSRRVDRPSVNPQAGFTQEALDWKTRMENLEGNLARMGAGQAGAAVDSTINDSRNQSVTVQVGGVVVNGAGNVNGQVGSAIGNAVGNAGASAARASRFEKDDAF